MIKKNPPLDRDSNRDPNIKAMKRRGVINHGSPLGLQGSVLQGAELR